MNKKLVYVAGKPYWMTPEGRFVAVDSVEGKLIERIYLRTPMGLRPLEDPHRVQA
jgi:hypothetical protein